MMAENIYRGGRVFYPEINWDGAGPSYNGREFQLVTFIGASIYRLTGQVDWVGRVVSVLFGIWGIFALHQVIALVWDQRRALAGAAMLAILPGSLFVDREFLPDPAMVALVTTACWLSLRYLQFGRRRDLFLAALAMTLGFLAKLTGVCVVLAIAYAIVRCESSPRRRRLLLAGVPSAIPVLLYYWWAWHLSQTYAPHHFAGSQGFLWNSSLQDWLAQGYFLSGLLRELNNIWTTVGLACVAIGLAVRPAAPTSPRWFFHWWLLVSGGCYFLIGASHLVWQPYNFHLFDPPVAALAGHALISIADFARRSIGLTASRIALVAIPIAIGLTGVPYLRSVYGTATSDGHQMGLALRELSEPSDLIVTIPEFAGDPVTLYYARRHGWVFPPASVWPSIPENWDEAILSTESARWLEGLREQGARYLAIVSTQRDRLWKSNPVLADYVERHFEVRAETSGYVIFRAR